MKDNKKKRLYDAFSLLGDDKEECNVDLFIENQSEVALNEEPYPI